MASSGISQLAMFQWSYMSIWASAGSSVGIFIFEWLHLFLVSVFTTVLVFVHVYVCVCVWFLLITRLDRHTTCRRQEQERWVATKFGDVWQFHERMWGRGVECKGILLCPYFCWWTNTCRTSNVGKTMINHPPVITRNSLYKPFPNGWFIIGLPTLLIYGFVQE